MLFNEFYEYDAVAGLLAVLLFIFVDVLRIFQYRHGFYLLWRYVVKGETVEGAIMNNPIMEG